MQFGITGLSLPTKGHSYTLETSLDTPLSTRSLPRQNDNGLFSHWLPQSAATTPPSSVSLLFVALLHWHRQSTRFVHSETLYEILHCSNRIQCCPTGLCVLAVLFLSSTITNSLLYYVSLVKRMMFICNKYTLKHIRLQYFTSLIFIVDY